MSNLLQRSLLKLKNAFNFRALFSKTGSTFQAPPTFSTSITIRNSFTTTCITPSQKKSIIPSHQLGLFITPTLLPQHQASKPARLYSDWRELFGQDHLLFLSDKNIDAQIQTSSSILIMFYAPYCSHCRTSKPEFARAARMLSSERPHAKLAAIDCIMYPSVTQRFNVVGYPTFQYYQNGKMIGEYNSRRRAQDFVFFMTKMTA